VSERLILFAHGAGAGSAHPWMQRWHKRLESLGRVVSFDYPYMREPYMREPYMRDVQERRRRPDRRPELVAAHREALAAARSGHTGRVYLVGKSMGSRIGCHVSLEESVDGLVCFGYPLCGRGNRERLRDRVLLELRTPILFLQGTRDKFCPLDLLADVRARMQAPSQLHVVEAGDHGLEVTKAQLRQDGETQDDVDDRVLAAVASFVGG
jgi:predicted alpha/beta-hydrolase family hydrolase